MQGKNQTFYELKERFEEAGQREERQVCPVCQLTKEGVMRYLGSLSYENVNDPQERARLRAAGGFCNRHSWQWYSLKDALGTAIIFEDVARLFLQKLRQSQGQGQGDPFNTPSRSRSRGGGLWALLASVGPGEPDNNLKDRHEMGAPGIEKREELSLSHCPACEVELEVGERAVGEFVGGLNEEGFQQAYARSTGLCLPHLAWALEKVPAGSRQFVLEVEAEKWAAIQRELEEVTEKLNFDHTRGRRELGQERGAIFRSVWKAAGMEGLG